MAILPKSDMEILSQEIIHDDGHYRLRTGQRVRYLRIPVSTFDDDTMCRLYLLIPRLPDLPDSLWTTMTISQDENSSLKPVISMDPLPEIRTAWYERHVDILTLKSTRRFRSGVHEVRYNDVPAIAKIACFEWEMRRIERETWAYSLLEDHHSRHPNESPIAPKFLAHLTENGRIMGLLLEKVDGEPACVDDLEHCEILLRRLHRDLGLVHGDVNRYNFLVDRASGIGVRLVDFEHTEDFDESLAMAELLSLPAELTEETGRGATIDVK
ncbi:alpha-galactosidase A [Fusarium circinatum]|uniref:Alpha-galactosidase A n=1 Tax=Fusarium circinatum TaxID=48490 RepID=A0A8H5U7I1_FUSCI|nr:alpha-galactosidase A [Fusarium circinatum]